MTNFISRLRAMSARLGDPNSTEAPPETEGEPTRRRRSRVAIGLRCIRAGGLGAAGDR
ncbi:MAG: hypothetical protein HC895_17595, partial [Leptolyngbyaceae cyanobacterium SM1_3_5]|nr:hypothetical protein [Leptolyngbyaceae cyanobacterium SM1_3_5]